MKYARKMCQNCLWWRQENRDLAAEVERLTYELFELSCDLQVGPVQVPPKPPPEPIPFKKQGDDRGCDHPPDS